MYQNKYSAAYILSGLSVRMSIAIGLQEIDSSRQQENAHLRELHRTWQSCFCYEKYSSLILGRPSSIGSMKLPIEASDSDADRTFVRFSWIITSMIDVFSNEKDVLVVYTRISAIALEMDRVIESSSIPISCQEPPSDFVEESEKQLREWFWLRLSYLYLKLTMFRPFLLFYTCFSGQTNNNQYLEQQIIQVISRGTGECISSALSIIALLNKHSYGCNWFAATNLEPPCVVLLFYLLCESSEIVHEETVQNIRQSLKNAHHYLEQVPRIPLLNPLLDLLERHVGENDSLLQPLKVYEDEEQVVYSEQDFQQIWLQILETAGGINGLIS